MQIANCCIPALNTYKTTEKIGRFGVYFLKNQFDWVCDNEWKPQLSQTIFFAGAVIGTLFFGWMIDQYGRVWTMMIATLNVLVTGIATPFSNGFLTFAVFRFLMGMSYPTFFLCGYMLGEYEICSISRKARNKKMLVQKFIFSNFSCMFLNPNIFFPI